MSRTRHTPKRSRLTAAVFTALLLPAAAFAQDAASSDTETKNLDKITVTGSLIPQSQIETATQVITINAEDIHARGYTSVIDILRSSSLASGGVQGGETSASFTQGAETVSMFGLKPSYTKFLINGRPMGNYPALYNGTDAFNSVSGIPIDAVERVEILPGGASSLYGSDALAGVVNFILKKDYEGTTLNVRGGTYTEGGGNAVRLSLTNGFNAFDDRLHAITSVQYENSKPIWGYQRDLTDSTNTDGYSASPASRDYLVYGYRQISENGLGSNGYLFPDGVDCSAVTSQFGGTESYQTRAGYGNYCGSNYAPGYRTVKNGKEALQLYNRTTFNVNDNFDLYGEVLYSHTAAEYAAGSSYTWWGTGVKYGYYYDPDYDSLLNLQRAFSPEDIGGAGYKNIMDKDTTNSYTVTLGGKGSFGESWDYDIGFTRNETKLESRNFVRWADKINAYFDEHVLGPQLGLDPYFDAYPVFRPDYAAFYSVMSPQDFASFTGYGTAKSKTWDDTFRAQLTSTDLFSLPAGSAGLAVAVEAGNEGWDYQPIPGIMEGAVWGTTDVAGSGHRTKYAAMAELRVPIVDSLTASVSGRYDAYDAYGTKIDKATWSASLEFRPIDSLLFRGKYGTAFKSPTLPDQFQGLSGSYSYATDYYNCGLEGYTPADTDGCSARYDNAQYFGTKEGNPDLEPITADTWSMGVVWAPSANFSLGVDYYSWDIKNEVDQLSTDQILLQEYYCRNGEAGAGIISCDNAYAWVTRGSDGSLQEVYTPRINVARQKLQLFTVSSKYLQDIGRFGQLMFSANYTNKRKHELQSDSTQPFTDLINDPYANWVYDAGPKWKADASLAWSVSRWTSTLYANMLGATPNYLAYAQDSWDYVHSSGAKAGKWGTYTTFNLSVDYQAQENLRLSLQVNNIGNKLPDGQAYNYPGTSTTPYNNYIYSVYGRSVFAELRYDFGK
ncbi:TonB-dependent receptor [Pseudoxanthomonas sp.]|uniref:TonB-dependent receptor plug domain-containing protein n=1 Tax=Pseudoxanthomonas sp. TaxID=1871049 RepID=UPI0026074DE2|nr:TonB-dependent receptor [Pseudoxanthomonas sp.]WDS36439.1 MAG: TonB-dependent receptor [Pseudoxanthomonas sp.]